MNDPRHTPFPVPDASASKNVRQELLRDRILRKSQRARALAEQNIREITAWNAAHPSEPPISHVPDDIMLAFLDGKATIADIERAMIHAHGLRTLGEEENGL